MEMNRPHAFRETTLGTNSAISLLEKIILDINPEQMSPYPAVLPEGGQIYLINRGSNEDMQSKYFYITSHFVLQ